MSDNLNYVSLIIMVFSCMAHVQAKTDRLRPKTPSPVTPGVQPDRSDCPVICFHPLPRTSCLLHKFINAEERRPNAQLHSCCHFFRDNWDNLHHCEMPRVYFSLLGIQTDNFVNRTEI